MMQSRKLIWLITLVYLLTGAAPPPPPPALTISSISPTSTTAGGPGFTLTVKGSNFVNKSTVRWGGSSLPTTFSTGSQLTASVSAADIATNGLVQVTVANPGQSGVSNASSFEIDNPVPQLSSVSPATVAVGGAAFTLRATGSSFVSSSVILWNGTSRPTTFVNSTQLNAAIPASDLALSSAGQSQITVFNPSPGGGSSNLLSVAINISQPQITSLSPSNLQAGAAPFTLMVNGLNFVQTATVEWNGNSRATQFISGSQLTASIPAGDVATQGTAQVTVVNPPPGGASSTLPFTILPLTSNPLPTISSLSDTTSPAGWPGFPLTVKGTGFVVATIGQWNGLNLNTNVLSSSLLKSAIPLGDLATAGTAQVTISNPSPGGGTSSATNFSINAVATGTPGVIERSSIATDLTEADRDSGPSAISADGRFVAFISNADNLVPNDTNGVADAFLRDTCLGAPPGCTPSVVRVSLASDGAQANQGASDVGISANGRYIAFSSRASNLVPGVNSGVSNVLLRDTCFGAGVSCTPTTVLVSPDVNDSFEPALSADGRYVTFANEIVGGCDYYYGCSPNVYLAMIHDTCVGTASGCTPSTAVVSLANDGTQPNDTSADPQALISGDGRYVTFRSAGSNLVADSGGAGIFLRDTCNGASGCNPSTIRVAVGNSGVIPAGNLFEFAMSGKGRFVAFTSNATNVVVGDTNGFADVFVRDTCIGAPAGCMPSTTRVSLGNDGSQSNADNHVASINQDGRIVAFISEATNLVANDTSPFPKVFIRDTCAGITSGCTQATLRLSVALDGTVANNQSGPAALSASGAYIAFSSLASNLGPGDTN